MLVRIIYIESTMIFACLDSCLFGSLNSPVRICIDSIVIFRIILLSSEKRHCHIEASISLRFLGNIIIYECSKCGVHWQCFGLRRNLKYDIQKEVIWE